MRLFLTIILTIAVASLAIFAVQRFIRSSPGRTLTTTTTSIARALVAIVVFLALMYPSRKLSFTITFAASLVLILLLHHRMRKSTEREGGWYRLGSSVLMTGYISLALSGVALALKQYPSGSEHTKVEANNEE